MINRTVLHRPLSETIGVHSWDNDWIAYNKTHDFSGFKEIYDIGLKYVRFGANLKMVEKPDGSYDFNIWEDYLVGCNRYNLQPIIYFSPSVPDWRASMEYKAALELNYHLAKLFIQHFAGRGILWEGCNEAGLDVTSFWFGKVSMVENKTNHTVTLDKSVIEDWVHFDSYLNRLVQEYDQSSKFINGVVAAAARQKEDRFFMWGEMMNYAGNIGTFNTGDYYSLHPYVEKHTPEVWLENTDNPGSALIQMQGLIDKYGSKIPQIVTEQGFKTDISGITGQASLIARSIFVLDMLNVPIDIIFNFTAAKTYEGWALVDGTDNDLRERPSAQLVANLLKTLKGTTLVHYDIKDNSSYALFYQGLSGKYIVYWTTATAHDDSYNGTKFHLTSTPQIIKLSDTWQMYNNYVDDLEIVYDLNQSISLVYGALVDFINRLQGWINPIEIVPPSPIISDQIDRKAYAQIKPAIRLLEKQFNDVVDYLNINNIHGSKTFIHAEKVSLNVPDGLQLNIQYLETLRSNNRRLTNRVRLLQQILRENGLLS
jgi:hypothetical protein